jgi:hypothetical protein
MTEYIKLNAGDLVIGTSDPSKGVYSAEGKLIREGVEIVGSEEELEDLKTKMTRAALNTGGKIVKTSSSKGKKGKKPVKYKSDKAKVDSIKTQQSQSVDSYENPWDTYQPVKDEEPALETISFENDFGKIKSKVENVIEQDLAFMLVFSNEDEVVFEPKVGETLKFFRNRQSHLVYYPGVIFDWTDGVKKVMILFKAIDQDE